MLKIPLPSPALTAFRLPTCRMAQRLVLWMCRKAVIPCLLLFAFSMARGQANTTDSLTRASSWILNYYKHPDPDSLYYVYRFVTLSQVDSGEEPNVALLGFVASALKKDNMRISQFYESVKYSTNEKLVKSYAWILWYLSSKYSSSLLKEWAEMPEQTKMRHFLLEMRDKDPVNISELGLAQPVLLWSDFFATGSQNTMNVLLSKLDRYESTRFVEKQMAMDVVNSLRLHLKRDRQLVNYLKAYLNISIEPTTRILKELISEVESRK